MLFTQIPAQLNIIQYLKKMAPKRYEDHDADLDGSDDQSVDSNADAYGSDQGNSAKRRRYEKGSTEYSKRRERNNVAVKKSREKSRQKAKETTEQVKKLTSENENLVQKVQILSKELSVLKDLFLAHAGSVTQASEPLCVQPRQEATVDHGYTQLKVEMK